MERIMAPSNIGVLKEPRGFIKVLQFVFSICAFATTTSFSSYFTFDISCTDFAENANATITEEITYPFQIDGIDTTYSACGKAMKLIVVGDFSSGAKFFVGVGVVAFLYVLVAIGLYCFFSAIYETKGLVRILDFALHVVLAILWMVASCVWASGLSGLRSAAELDNIMKYNDVCDSYTCTKVTEALFGQLICSVMFGFLNVFIWGSNLWFLYKEIKSQKDMKPVEAIDATN